MMIRRPIASLAVTLLLTTSALAQQPVAPQAAQKEQSQKPAEKPAEKAKPKPPATAAKKPEPKPEPKLEPKPSAAPTPAAAAPVPDNPNADVVYGAYQRGEYKTAFGLAQPRAQAGDVHAMTMLGELYANGLGVKRDYDKAAEWYKRGADGGDREAMLALAMMRLGGFGGPGADKQEAVRLLASSAKLGEPKA